MKKSKLSLVVIIAIILILTILLIMPKSEKENETNFNEPNVIEFPPLTLCRNTGGEWKAVNSNEFTVNSEQGVYNPTTNPKTNFKCFCAVDKKWDEEEGCII